MHIIIGLITAIAGLVWALNALQRAGFNFSALNPFYWMRRRAWQNQQVNPLYAIESPREAAALLAYGLARLSGELTSDDKSQLISLFESELSYEPEDARQMYGVASHLVSTDPNFDHHVDVILKPSLDHFTAPQIALFSELLEKAVPPDGRSQQQQKMVSGIEQQLKRLQR